MRMNFLVSLVITFLLCLQENLVFSGVVDLESLTKSCRLYLRECDAFFCEMTRANAQDKIQSEFPTLQSKGTSLEAAVLEGVDIVKEQLVT